MKLLRKTSPIIKTISSSIIDLPTPINISLWWNYGSLLGLLLSIQIITGITLSIHYTPDINLAFLSLTHITRNVNWGWLLHNLHINGASIFMLFIYVHIGRRIYYNSFYIKKTWNIGVSIFILTIATAFIGYVLPWGQIRFWGATVITNIFSAIPYIGKTTVEWLWGGFAVRNPTLSRFFILHFLTPLVICIIIVFHLVFLHESGSNNPIGILSNSDRISFHPYFTIKDIVGLLPSTLIISIIAMVAPNTLIDPENFIEANSLITPTHIQPEWYFLWLYAILRSIPNKLGGVIALLSAIIILYYPRSISIKKISLRFCPVIKIFFFIIVNSWFILSWIGICPVEEPFILIGQIFRRIYFLYFFSIKYISNFWFINQ